MVIQGASAKFWQSRVWSILSTGLLAIVVLVIALLTVGLFIPIPLLDVLASMLSARFEWTLPISAFVALLSLLRWRAGPTRLRALLVALSGVTLFGWIIVSVHLLSFAYANGTTIDAAQLFLGQRVNNRAPDLTIEYTQYDGQPLTLSVWRPAGISAGAPVLVMTHGGGFVGGSVEEQLLPYARWLANNGYLVIGANYTLSSKKMHAWNVAEGQIACALAWAKAHASHYGGDISRLGMYGESAGGNLVINTSYKIASGALASSCGGDLPRVKAVSAIYPVVGIIESYNNPHLVGIIGRQFDEQYLGGTPEQFPLRYASAQSVNAITNGAPPTLIVYGGSDHLVPPSGTRTFVAAATKGGVTVRAIEIPYSEHGFDLYNTGGVGAQIWRQNILRWFRETLHP